MAQPTKVFVGSLPTGTKPEELRRLFENYGVVVECDVMNRCGFVHMKNAAMAESAIGALHDTKFKGQNIVVEYGIPKERKQGGGAVQGGGRGARGGRGGGGDRGILVGFPGTQDSNKFNQAATLQLAGVIMELLGDQQNQLDDISGGNNIRGSDPGYRRGGGGNQGGRGGNFQGGNRRSNQNVNGVGPIRNQGYKGDRPTPYTQAMHTGGPINANQSGGGGGGHGGGRFSNQPNRSGGANGSTGNFNNVRGGNFAPKPALNNYGSGNSWNNEQRGGMPQQSGRNFAEENFSGGFSGNMGNSGAGNFGGQQDRRGFALPSNQFQQYSGGNGNQMSGFAGNEGSSSYGDDAIFQRRNNNPPNVPIIIDFRSGKGGGNVGSGNFNRGSNPSGRGGGGQGGFQNNRGSQGFQHGGGFKRGGPGGNLNSGESYHQNFSPLGSNATGAQGGFGGNRNYVGQGGRGGGGGGMNRNAPRQNMPNRRY